MCDCHCFYREKYEKLKRENIEYSETIFNLESNYKHKLIDSENKILELREEISRLQNELRKNLEQNKNIFCENSQLKIKIVIYLQK